MEPRDLVPIPAPSTRVSCRELPAPWRAHTFNEEVNHGTGATRDGAWKAPDQHLALG